MPVEKCFEKRQGLSKRLATVKHIISSYPLSHTRGDKTPVRTVLRCSREDAGILTNLRACLAVRESALAKSTMATWRKINAAKYSRWSVDTKSKKFRSRKSKMAKEFQLWYKYKERNSKETTNNLFNKLHSRWLTL